MAEMRGAGSEAGRSERGCEGRGSDARCEGCAGRGSDARCEDGGCGGRGSDEADREGVRGEVGCAGRSLSVSAAELDAKVEPGSARG